MEEIVTIDGKQFKLMYDKPITPELRMRTINDIKKSFGCKTCGNITSLAASCPSSKQAGDPIGLGAAPIGGTPPYTVTFQKKVGTNTPVQIGQQVVLTDAPDATTNVVTNPTLSYPLTEADVAGAVADGTATPPLAGGYIRIITTVVDSCVGSGGPSTCSEICDISLVCVSQTCNAIIT